MKMANSVDTFIPRLFVAVLFLLCYCVDTAHADTQPSFQKNAWQLLFVPTFETSGPDNERLSIEGLNHSLLFGQLLSSLTAGLGKTVMGVYAWSTPTRSCKSDPDNMSVLQTVTPYAVLNNLGVNFNLVSCGTESKCDCADKSTYNSPAFLIDNILSNSPKGIYIVAMPKEAINEVLRSLPHIKNVKSIARVENSHQYVLASIDAASTSLQRFDDGLIPKKIYPAVNIGEAITGKCPQKAASLFIAAPKHSFFKINTNATVSFIRHVEAHPNAGFENGNYVCAGQWRALGANAIIRKKLDYMPDYLLTTNPSGIIACDGTCSYIRPTLTIEPFATEYGKAVDIAAFPWNDAESLAAALFTQNSPFSKAKYDNAKGLVAWEHAHIEKAVRYLIGTIYQRPDALKDLPQWSYTDYDTIWTLATDAQGNLQFTNSCEGISTDLLPSTCPAFMSAR